MKNLTLIQETKGTFTAGSSETLDEMHSLTGSIYELWVIASDLLKDDANTDEQPLFNFEEFGYKCDDYQTEFNCDLNGYVITFSDGKVAQTQINIETNALHADYNEQYLERYTEYDDELSEEQHTLVDDFVVQVNKLKHYFG